VKKVSKSNAKEIYFDKLANKEDTERKNSDQQQKNPQK
jgi:hypothetical protein